MAHVDGDGVEKLAALLLRHRFPDAWRVNPGQGDRGVDIYRRTPDGLQVWQIKRFATPLGNGQRNQVRRSWTRFHDEYPAKGIKIASYTLVTVWTPTEAALKWFHSTVVADAQFEANWDGELFFDTLDAAFPHVVERFLKPDFLESAVTAKASLASSPVEVSDAFSMLEAVRRRDVALAEVRDLVSDHYRIDSAIITTGSMTTPPLAQLSAAAAIHRMTPMEGGRWQVESAVPRTADALRDDPIALEVDFSVEPGTTAAESVELWDTWGVPFDDIPARVRRTGGPFESTGHEDGLISFLPTPEPQDPERRVPDLAFCDVHGRHRVRFIVEELTRGRVGGGRRLVATSRSGLLRLEMRSDSTTAPDAWSLALNDTAGLDPVRVRSELRALSRLGSSSGQSVEFQIRFVLDDDDPELAVEEVHATGADLVPPPLTKWLLEIAEALIVLSEYTSQQLEMPDIREVTTEQLDDLLWHADIYRGKSITTTWDKVTYSIADPTGLASVWETNADGYLIETLCPALPLGADIIELEWPYARTVRMPPTPPGLTALQPGSEIDFFPGVDNTLSIGVVVDEEKKSNGLPEAESGS